jgi:hypothetical protein
MAETKGPKYIIDFEGKDYPWNESTITPTQLRELVGLPADQALLVVHLDTGAEDPFERDTAYELKPGVGFSKKIGFKRG